MTYSDLPPSNSSLLPFNMDIPNFYQGTSDDLSGLPSDSMSSYRDELGLDSSTNSCFDMNYYDSAPLDLGLQPLDAPWHMPSQSSFDPTSTLNNPEEQIQAPMNYSDALSSPTAQEWLSGSLTGHDSDMQHVGEESIGHSAEPKSGLSKLNKNFKHIKYDAKCIIIHNDILGHIREPDEQWRVSFARGRQHWGYLSVMYSRDKKKCTTAENDETFPTEDCQKDHYAQELFDALVDWSDYKEKRPSFSSKSLNDAQMAILGQTLTPYKTECLAYLLVEAAVNSQQGALLFAPWSSANDCWESYPNFADRISHMCESLRGSKQLVKSLIADGQTWANRIASRPKKEIKSKEGNKKLNDGKKDKLRSLERRVKA